MNRPVVFGLVVLLSLVCLVSVVPTASALISTGDGSWVWQNPLPQGNCLHDLCFCGPNGWAVGGAGGVILATSDGGATWSAQRSETGACLESVSFPDASHGWAVGSGGTILATTDGGTTWERQDSGTDLWLNGVSFPDATHGYAVGNVDTLLTTTDGGATWRLRDPYVEDNWALRDVCFVDASHGWIAGSSGLYTTTDGGAHWTVSTEVGPNMESLCFLDASNGWAVGGGGDHSIRVTTDGGTTWSSQSTPPGPAIGRLADVVFHDASHGWAVGQSGLVISTTDGGATWENRVRSGEPDLLAVGCSDADHIVAVGDMGTMLATTDGGLTWGSPVPEGHGITRYLFDISFLDANRGWAVGGAILATTNGGAQWVVQRPPRKYPPWDYFDGVAFADENTGFVVGWGFDTRSGQANGLMLATTDGGATWRPRYWRESGTPERLAEVTFPDAVHGWVVGEGGSILATSDSGVTWRYQASGTSRNLHSVDFSDARRGWVVGDRGVVRVTTDGGSTWRAQRSGTTAPLTAVAFADAAHGWAVGPETILHTTNGGATWRPQGLGRYDAVSDVACSDSNHAWVVTGSAAIYATVNGGATWRGQRSGYGQAGETLAYYAHLYGVATAGSRHAWAVGTFGTVLATTNGGAPPVTTASVAAVRWYHAPVKVTLTASHPAGLPVAYTEYRLDASPWTRGGECTVAASADHSNDGAHTLTYRSADDTGAVETTRRVIVGIDTVRPSTVAPAGASAARGRTATLKYKVIDAAPNGGKAKVVIQIRNRSGKVVKTLRLGLRKVNVVGSARFTCGLARGTYGFYILASDLAGNRQSAVGHNRLVVR